MEASDSFPGVFEVVVLGVLPPLGSGVEPMETLSDSVPALEQEQVWGWDNFGSGPWTGAPAAAAAWNAEE